MGKRCEYRRQRVKILYSCFFQCKLSIKFANKYIYNENRDFFLYTEHSSTYLVCKYSLNILVSNKVFMEHWKHDLQLSLTSDNIAFLNVIVFE